MRRTGGALLAMVASVLLPASLTAAETTSVDEGMSRMAADYAVRLETAASQLAAARERIELEREPLIEQQSRLQDQAATLESEILRLRTDRAHTARRQQALSSELEAAGRTMVYLSNLAEDGLKGANDALRPGEAQLVGQQVESLLRTLEGKAEPEAARILETLDMLVDRLERSVGGYTAPGQALVTGGNDVLVGTFMFMGPEVFFRADEGGVAGTVRNREGAPLPVVYPLVGWSQDEAKPLFEGRPGTIMADASGGKALKLRDARGTLWQHIRKGGFVGFTILLLGAVALVITVLKALDLRQSSVDQPGAVQKVLDVVAQGGADDAGRAVLTLGRTVRELFLAGLSGLGMPKEVIEERLEAWIMQQRMHGERRLPLLAVITTASPLLGLLGTVTGMVKTFTLITIYGTGNAAKLSSGISEALVTTELGLTVAIPTLIVHGYLAHRARKNLALLERYSTEFVRIAEESRVRRMPSESPTT